MRKALKIPGFLIKLIDAFLLRIPTALIITYLLFKVHGVKDSQIDKFTIEYVMFTFAFPLAFAWGFIYVICGRPHSPGAYAWGNVGKVLIAILIAKIIMEKAVEGDGIVPYVMNLGLSAKLVIGWVIYSICSWIVKSKKSKKAKKNKGAGEKKLRAVMDEVQAVSNAFVMMNISQMDKKREQLAQPKPEIKKEKKEEVSLKPSGALSEKEFYGELKKKGYTIVRLKGDMTIVFAGKSGFVLKFIREKGNYTFENSMWFKDGEPYEDVTVEVNSITNLLRSKCSMTWTRGLVVKTFSGGKVPATHHLKYAEVYKNYDAAEQHILDHVAPDRNNGNNTCQTLEKIKKTFADKIEKQGGEM